MGHEVIVDGYNVIKNNEMYRSAQKGGLEHARALLIQHLRYRFRDGTETVIVVFDGDGEREQASHVNHIRVIFSQRGESADSVIARLAAEARRAGHSVEMYSSDAEVQTKVVLQGGSAYSTGQLSRQLQPTPSDVLQRFEHRQKMKRMYGLDPAYKPDDEEEPSTNRPGKKKKRRRRR